MSAAEARLEGLTDPDVLAFATRQGRILISHDTSTMPVHFAEVLRTGGHSPGVLLVRQRASCGEVVEALLMVWSASIAEAWANQIYYLPSFTRHAFRR
jgi:predicted nuclease of predicted toxin-antitoxin system